MKTSLLAASIGAFIALSPNVPASTQSAPVMAANAASATATLKMIAVAQVGYTTICGNGGYAPSLKVLATPPPGTTESFLTQDLKPEQHEKSGYRFVLTAGVKSGPGPVDCSGNKTVTKFYAAATPLTLGVTGGRSFAVNETNTIWMLDGGLAPREPFGPPATPLK